MPSKKINLNTGYPLVTLVVLVSLLSLQLVEVPPLGLLLHPFRGFIQNEKEQDSPGTQPFIQPAALREGVRIAFDTRSVPHIYANNDDDLYFTQGYITACFRLWQMDFVSYLAAGRLSEILGNEYLGYDRNQRRIGVVQAARASLQLLEQDPVTKKMLASYTDGVNAYIKQLTYKDLPLEYKIFDYKPEPWTPLKTFLIMKRMAANLSGYEEDLSMTNSILALGEEKFNKLFPAFHTNSTPVVSKTIEPFNSSLIYQKKPDYLDNSYLTTITGSPENGSQPAVGSNSWVVSGKKTVAGYPILASDPHLQLSLPAIWFELQLTAPGVNVYGVSVPGVPAILIGFNETIAWGITNGNDDVKDWYKLTIHPDGKQYEWDGKWLPLHLRIDTIQQRSKGFFYDTVYYTQHGPIVYDKSFPGKQPQLLQHALKWEFQRASNELYNYRQLNRAANYADFTAAIKKFGSPVLNFTFACKDNTIAVHHQGNMPIKWPGQGRFILNGALSSHLYNKNIPADSLPYLVNPDCNYVIAANQQPTNQQYAYYYNGLYRENRANRIKQLLEKGTAFDLPQMKAMQLDDTNPFAVDALPLLVQQLDFAALSVSEKILLDDLQRWKGSYGLDDRYAKLFELWWEKTKDLCWDEFRQAPLNAQPPQDQVLLNLIREDGNNEFFDKLNTYAIEYAKDIIHEAFTEAAKAYNKLASTKGVKWGVLNNANIRALANIQALGSRNLPSAWHPETINAISGNLGPSWRMVVALGERPVAFGIYPGGQSGNSGSSRYDDFISDWNTGKYYPLVFYMSAFEANNEAAFTWSYDKK